jgi:predicted alpha/beta hydrolase
MIYSRLLVAGACLLALTGCTLATTAGSRRPSAAAWGTWGTWGTPARTSAVQRCGGPATPSTPVDVVSHDGAVLATYESGTGHRGVLLVPELGNRNLCGWWSYASFLARHGFRVLLFDHQCAGQSTCPTDEDASSLIEDIEAATAALTRDGAQRIVLIGASQGGAEVVIAGAHLSSDVAGVVALSADSLDEDLATRPIAPTAKEAASSLRVPCLFAVARGDPYVSVVETRHLVASVPASAKRLIIEPSDSGHGWDMLTSAPAAAGHQLSTQIVGFLRSVMP